jgi:hypothetical protein
VLAAVAYELTGPQLANDLDRLLQHLEPYVDLGPSVTEDVLVQCLARSHAKAEPAWQQRGGRGGGLRDDRWMDAQVGAGHRRRDRKVDCLGQRADHRPDERTLPLLVVPGMEVVGDPQGIEAGVLGAAGLIDERVRVVLLAGQEVADHGLT